MKYFDRSEGEEETSLFLTTNEVIAKLSEKASFEQKRFSAKRLGAILNKQFIRTSKNNRYGYLLREKESDNNSILGVF